MKLTREKATILYQVFDRIIKNGEIKNVKFNYALIKNKKALESEVKTLEEASKPLEGYVEFERERMTLCQELAEKDEAGVAKVEGNKYVFSPDNYATLELRIRELIDTKYQEALQDQQKREIQFQVLLQEEVDIELLKMNISEVPDVFNGSELELIYDLLEG